MYKEREYLERKARAEGGSPLMQGQQPGETEKRKKEEASWSSEVPSSSHLNSTLHSVCSGMNTE